MHHPLIITNMADQYERMMQQSRQLATRMRNGTGAAALLTADNAPTHHMDALERFQKDFSQYQHKRREQEKLRRQEELERRRIQLLDRQNNRWQLEEQYHQRIKSREQANNQRQRLGIKKTANSHGLPYNPITLEYDRNPEGAKLKKLDEQTRIRGYVRAHNIDRHGNSSYNILNGQERVGVEKIVPQQLNQRYQQRKLHHYDQLRLKIPGSAEPALYGRYY